MPRFTLKMNVFPSISSKTPKMCVETLRTVLVFSTMIDLRGHMPRCTLKMNVFSHLSPYKPHKCVLKPSEHCLFFPR